MAIHDSISNMVREALIELNVFLPNANKIIEGSKIENNLLLK